MEINNVNVNHLELSLFYACNFMLFVGIINKEALFMKQYINTLAIFGVMACFSYSLFAAEAEKTDTSQAIQPRVVFVNEKSPFTAGALGALAGFGLGNFYAENNQLGALGLVSEVIGFGLFFGGWFSADDDNDGFLERTEIKWDNLDSKEAGLFYGGLGIILASRIFGTITGVHEAKKYNERLNKKFRYESRLEPKLDFSKNSSFIGLAYNF